MSRKSDRQAEADRTKRRAHIRRGMKIALYEINQVLEARGEKIIVAPEWIDYTVALAEGGRSGASMEDVYERLGWETMVRARAYAAQRRAVSFLASLFAR